MATLLSFSLPHNEATVALSRQRKKGRGAMMQEWKRQRHPVPARVLEREGRLPSLFLIFLSLFSLYLSHRTAVGRREPACFQKEKEREGKKKRGLSKYFSPSSPPPASPLSPLGMAFPVLARKEEGRIGLGTEEKKKGRGVGSLFPPSEERVAQGYTTRSRGGKEGREPPPPSSFP